MVAGAPLSPGVRHCRRRRRARRDARPGRRASGRPRAAGGGRLRAHHRRPGRPGGRRRVRDRAADLARRIGMPVRPRLGRSRPHRAAAAGRLSRPTGRPPPAGPVPDAHRLRGVGRRDDPLATAPFLVAADVDGKRSRPRSASAQRSRRTRSRACSTTWSSTDGSCGTPIATTSWCGSSGAWTRSGSARRCAARSRAPRRRRHSSPACAPRSSACSWPAGRAAARTRRPAPRDVG